jgi:hypothetical protein
VPIGHDVAIVEPKHAVAWALQISVASRVAPLVLSLEVLGAVDLDDEPCIVTDEIDDERSDWSLPPKARAIEPMSAHAVPDDPLGVSEAPPQRP